MDRLATIVGAATLALVLGCGADARSQAEPEPADPTEVGAPPESPEAPDNQPDAPDNQSELTTFLSSNGFGNWEAEPAFHASLGPHASSVRVYYGPTAARALRAAADTFPKGAAIVKEFEGGGWAFWIKVDADSDDGRGFFWYEQTGGKIYGNARGNPDCVGCHRTGRDFLLSTGNFE